MKRSKALFDFKGNIFIIFHRSILRPLNVPHKDLIQGSLSLEVKSRGGCIVCEGGREVEMASEWRGALFYPQSYACMYTYCGYHVITQCMHTEMSIFASIDELLVGRRGRGKLKLTHTR